MWENQATWPGGRELSLNSLPDGLLSVMHTATGRRWGQVSDKGAPSSDRNLFSAFSFLPVTQLSYVAEDENGKIVGYVLAKM